MAAQQRAQNADIATTQTDLAAQTANLQRLFGGVLQPAGAAAAGTLNGAPSLALAPLGALGLSFGAGR